VGSQGGEAMKGVTAHTGQVVRWEPAPASGTAAAAAGPVAKPSVLKDLGTVIVLFVALRGLLFGFNYVGRSMTQMTNPALCFSRLGPFWDAWIRYDAGWYWGLVRHGYAIPGDGKWTTQSNVVFFPLYPYLIRMATKLVGGTNHWYAGLAISNVATALALFFMLRIARRYVDEDCARRSLVYLLLFPSSFFLSSYYTEGLFLLTVTAAFASYLKKRYFLCGVWGYLAAMIRNPGVLLFPSFVLGLLWERRGRLTRADLPALWLLLIPCGLLTFMAILHHKPLNMVRMMDIASGVLFLILPVWLLKKYDKSLVIFALLALLMPMASGTVRSMMRYELVAFPSFFVLAELGANRDVDRVIVSTFAIFLGLLNLAFTNWYFVG
jgi:hypothetical protein